MMTTQVVKLKMVEMDTNIQKRDGGSYKGTQLTYEVDGQTRTKAIHSTVVNNNAELSAQLSALADTKMPTMVTLNTVKTEDGFVNLIGITPFTDQEQESTNSSTTQSTNAGGSQAIFTTEFTTDTKTSRSPTRKTYDSSGKEESIVRAVALKAAVEYGASKDFSTDRTIQIAQEFAEFLRGN